MEIKELTDEQFKRVRTLFLARLRGDTQLIDAFINEQGQLVLILEDFDDGTRWNYVAKELSRNDIDYVITGKAKEQELYE